MYFQDTREFGSVSDAVEIPELSRLQRSSYEKFLQAQADPEHRREHGLEGLLREIFPIVSYDENLRLEYISYDLGRPRYSPDECRQLRLTYGVPFRIRCRMIRKDKNEIMEDNVYLGELPVMIGGGEFIINGAERVIVNQLHRSPGVDFVIESQEGDRPLHGCRVIPERGSWIEINITKKDVMVVRIDQSSKLSATTFLRAMDEKYSKTEDIIREFHPTKNVTVDKLKADMWVVGPVVDKETGEVLVKAGCQVGDALTQIQQGASLVTPVQVTVSQVQNYINKKFEFSTTSLPFVGSDADAILDSLKNVGVKAEGEEADESEPKSTDHKILRLVKGRLLAEIVPRFNKNESKVGKQKWNNVDDRLKEWVEQLRVGDDCVWESAGDFKKQRVDNKPGVIFIREKETSEIVWIGISTTGGLRSRVANCLTGKEKSISDINNSLRKNVADWLAKLPKGKGAGIKKVEVVENLQDQIIMNSLAEDPCEDHEQALLRIYSRLRPGNPAQSEKAKTLFKEKFYDANRYRLGKVGRFRLNRKFKQEISEEEMTLRPEDLLNSLKYLFGLRNGLGYVDDIDHLGNRRLRTIDELATDELRKGFLKLRRAVQERMSIKDPDTITRVAELVNSKSISSSIDYFFGRGELSQVVDQTNPLSQLTHERRLSALGPGGLNRKRAGFEVRDVHISHYGRICPIETPEGTNIGLIASLGVFADVDEYGFLVTPYQKVQRGKVTDIEYLRADQEMETILAPTDVLAKDDAKLEKGPALARVEGDLAQVDSSEVEYVDVSSKQTVGVSAALIPFLEHDDANRALMGSNMQRQAVPLLQTEPPIVATGMEKNVAQNSSMVVRAESAGTVTDVDARRIKIDNSDEYVLRKFVGLNERTCLNQKPVVMVGKRVKKGEVIADGAATCQGELALGRNILVGFMMFDGYNFEDAMLISEKLVKQDVYTSMHIEEYEVEIRETKLGREEFTCDIPNVSEKALASLDEGGVVQVGTCVTAGDILVGKVSPKSKSELSPEEKLLYAIFGRAGEDVKNDSLELPSGQEGIVIDAKRFSRRMYMSDEQRKAHNRAIKDFKQEMSHKCCEVFRQMSHALTEKLSVVVVDPSTRQKMGASDVDEVIAEQVENFEIGWIKPAAKREAAEKVIQPYLEKISELQEQTQRKLQQMKRGDELPSGVLEMVKIYVATKRRLAVGDKMAGRHGNKGVIARILPEEDMPFLEDGTPLDVLLNPLGVPSRMNVGQILETYLGWAAKILGFQALTPVFDGASEEEIQKVMEEANQTVRESVREIEENKKTPPPDQLYVQMPHSGKITVYDGRTGEPFDQNIAIGYMYLMKLHHLVDDKIHARATGPYSLITQQPLGGKARTGGQRFGEMEVWGLEAYGTAYILQELLTVKSDDVEGRTKIYESMVKGLNCLEAGTPVSFDVLCNEIRGLGLNIQLEKKRII